MKEKILITCALPYVNNVPHLGHIAGCHLPADVFYRFHKNCGDDVVFVGGADSHGTATLIGAKEVGLTPDEFVDKLTDIHRTIYKKLGISYDLFSSTKTKIHAKNTLEFFDLLQKNGYIEELPSTMLYCEHDKIALADRYVIGTCPYCGYEEAYGDQCDKCGKTYEITELINPKCKFCGEPAVFKDTKHLYLSLDKLSEELDSWIENKKSIWRNSVYQEAKRWINEGLKPRCITRDIPWGVNVPVKGYEDKVFYVWFDAPIGYISITEELGGKEMVKKYWQSDDAKIYNFIGKDNIPFHTVFFPAMELGVKKYNLAYNVAGFAFLNFEGQKFSKSKKIGVFCNGLLDSDIDIDTLRAYLVSNFPEAKDSDFRWADYKDVVNADLVGKYGNFFNRTLNMIYKNFAGELNFELTEDVVLDENDKTMLDAIKEMPNEIAKNYADTEFRQAYKNIMKFASIGNQYLEKTAPWTLIKEEKFNEVRKILYICLNMAKSLAIVANPIIPQRTQEIWTEQLNFEGELNGGVDFFEATKVNISKAHKTNPPKPLYARVDDERLEKLKEELCVPFDLETLKD